MYLCSFDGWKLVTRNFLLRTSPDEDSGVLKRMDDFHPDQRQVQPAAGGLRTGGGGGGVSESCLVLVAEDLHEVEGGACRLEIGFVVDRVQRHLSW